MIEATQDYSCGCPTAAPAHSLWPIASGISSAVSPSASGRRCSSGEAREAWRVIRDKVSRGIDPAIQDEPRQKDEFGEVAAEWLRRDQADNRSRGEVVRLLNRDVLPHWQHKPIAEITRRNALELIDRVVDRGSPVMARRLHAHVHRLFEWAVGRGIVEVNPMHRLPKAGDETPRDRMLSENELRLVWRSAVDMGWPFGSAYQLLILTGARLSEIGELRWSEIGRRHYQARRRPYQERATTYDSAKRSSPDCDRGAASYAR